MGRRRGEKGKQGGRESEEKGVIVGGELVEACDGRLREEERGADSGECFVRGGL